MEDFANVSGYSELKYAPIVPLGHSAMATYPWNFAAWNPDRTLAIISLHGDAPRTNLTGYGRDNMEWGKRTIDGIPGLLIEGEYEWWEDRVNPALAFRMMYPKSCVSFLCDTGRGHFDIVLNTVGTIRLGWINISVSALPIIVGALLYGPGGGLMVGLVGAFLGQLMTYGVTATTVLWIIPPAVRGLLIGLYAKRCGYALSRRQLVGVLIVTSLVVTLLNTGAIYLDSVIYGYYTYAYVFGKVGIRIVSGAVTAVAMAFVTPPVLDMLKRSLRAAQRA